MPEGKYGAPYRRSRSTPATGHDGKSTYSKPMSEKKASYSKSNPKSSHSKSSY